MIVTISFRNSRDVFQTSLCLSFINTSVDQSSLAKVAQANLHTFWLKEKKKKSYLFPLQFVLPADTREKRRKKIESTFELSLGQNSKFQFWLQKPSSTCSFPHPPFYLSLLRKLHKDS